MIVKQGERVRLRMVNLGMDHHPIHLHGTPVRRDRHRGRPRPAAAWEPGNTVLVGVAQARDIEFDAKYLGDWMLHCHLPHHMMNQMVSMVGPMSMSHASGLPTGRGLDDGMGMLQQGDALADDVGPSLGRAVGVGADADRAVTNMPLDGLGSRDRARRRARRMACRSRPMRMIVPGYPQDMWMVMDEAFAGKPETHELRTDWTAGMMGMMTLVRVVEPGLFDEIDALRRRAASAAARAGPANPNDDHADDVRGGR